MTGEGSKAGGVLVLSAAAGVVSQVSGAISWPKDPSPPTGATRRG